jgi:acetyl esterase
VIFVHYSLSPEHPFPTAIQECYAVLEWVTDPSNTSFLKIDSTRVAIGGDSSGANIAIAVSCKNLHSLFLLSTFSNMPLYKCLLNNVN